MTTILEELRQYDKIPHSIRLIREHLDILTQTIARAVDEIERLSAKQPVEGRTAPDVCSDCGRSLMDYSHSACCHVEPSA